jgi:NAD(P)-dependent dehydrogenase (short-subunit alcohol dehydrogenase family)
MILHEKVAIITGCYRGFGKSIAERFIYEGANVAICDLVPVHELQERFHAMDREKPQILWFQTDVSQEDQVNALVAETYEQYQRIDILVNNVGIAGPTKDCWNITLNEWNQTLAVNLGSAFLCSKAVLPHMIRQRAGRIINLSSIAGKQPIAHRTPYATSKMGLIGLTRALATDVGQYGITVNAICPGNPGGLRNQEVAHALATYQHHPFDPKQYTHNHNIVRQQGILAGEHRRTEGFVNALITHDDVAALAVFLASDAASHITGQDINVSSGTIMW